MPHADDYASRDWLRGGPSDGGIEVDPVLLAKYAGRDYNPSEQREFIEEEGEARNLWRLQIDQTHYVDCFDPSDTVGW